MKRIFALITILIVLQARAQTPFEGKVVYRLQSAKEKQVAVVIAYFGKQRLRIEFTENGRPTDKEVVVVALDSGTVTTLNTEVQTFSVKKLQKQNAVPSTPRQIAGYTTRPHQAETPASGWLGSYLGQSVLYAADSLFFPVPPAYKSNPELIMVHDDKVVLGADIGMGPGTYTPSLTAEDSAAIERNRINAEAIEVKKYPVADSLFTVPVGFAAEPVYDYRSDTTVVTDTTMKDPRRSAPKKKKSKPTNKPTNPKKPPAYRRKNG